MRTARNKWKAVKNIFTSRTIVLCYHRIAPVEFDPWGLCVSPANFEQQLNLLKNKYRVLPVSSLFDGSGLKPGSKSVCITFDDGYLDNFTTAKPLLERYSLPACFFIASGYINKPQAFWWDELARIILGSGYLPPTLSLVVGNKHFTSDITDCSLLSESEMEDLLHWNAKSPSVNKRCVLFLQLWDLFRSLSVEEATEAMTKLRTWSGFRPDQITQDLLPMGVDHLQQLSGNSLFTIGLHTANHLALGLHPAHLQEAEILENRNDLENSLQKKMQVISFPYGIFNEQTLNLVNKHSLAAGFTSEKKVLTSRSARNRIGRFAVGNWNEAAFEAKLENWFRNR